MAVEVVDPLEMVEVEQEQNAGPFGFERGLEPMQKFAAVGETGHGIGVGVALGEPLGLLVGLERLFQILRPPPAKEDDRDIENERRPEALVDRHMRETEGRRKHLASQPDEHQNGRNGRAAGDQMAACDPDRFASCARHLRLHSCWC